MRKPTAQELLEIRKSIGCDVDYARRVHVKQQIRDELQQPNADLKTILLWLVTELL